MRTINYILRYFLARSLYNAARRSETVSHHRQLRLRDGDEVIMPGRGHFKVINGQWVQQPTETPIRPA